MQPAIGLVETNSIAVGIKVGDAMVKRAPVNLLEARTVCPGKYIVLVGGDTGPVKESMAAGVETAGDSMVDRLFLPNVHVSIFPAIASAVEMEEVEALGIIETFSVASTIVAADAAAKAADVTLTEVRLANGLGGKSFVLMVGDVPNVEAAVEAGVNIIKDEGLLVRFVVIPQLHEDMRQKIV
ncbi:MAG TPA: BMC domain-containing protein [Anaerolineae bacterium]|nr:BMC domain-containing protein [Anaerolineae bacterium]